ncbi:type III-A CRISPR-associated protein Csm2 [Agriterribacter sp.]|uniref:type III-A CRISPR-associated protein Csm2 n=1 Tax=Agriterribacter sp. TaxID=2821509 RepID=UPI002C7BA125|nr:type III-A CRISPR-associated protein Csm2 [Agriterribacter sp.]HRP56363.1 type III-A CRISPR-associated protein Csm2 [Agriterribacter sp.]
MAASYDSSRHRTDYGGQGRNPQKTKDMQKPPKIDTSMLENGISASQIENLKEWGKYFANDEGGVKVTTSQLRKFFGEIKRIQADFENASMDLILLDPKIAYAVGRAKKEARGDKKVKIEDFYNQIAPMVSKIGNSQKKFKHFVQICEAIVAYHKQYGGDN